MNTQTENLNIEMSAQDIILMVNIISTVSKRGAFQPEEFQIVGTLFEKLKSFVVVEKEEQLKLDFPTTEQ